MGKPRGRVSGSARVNKISYGRRQRAFVSTFYFLIFPFYFFMPASGSLQRLVRPHRVHVEILSLKESAEERRPFIRDADNLIRCLTIEFEIELRLGSTVVPVGKKFELAPPQAPLRERCASDGDAHARRLPGDPAFFFRPFSRGYHPPSSSALSPV